eukprot:939477-Amorphochlora_amoeboformis.AAC.1
MAGGCGLSTSSTIEYLAALDAGCRVLIECRVIITHCRAAQAAARDREVIYAYMVPRNGCGRSRSLRMTLRRHSQ